MRKIVSSSSRLFFAERGVAEDGLVDQLAFARHQQQRARQQPRLDVALGEEAVDAGEALAVEAERGGAGEGEGHGFVSACGPMDEA